MVKLSEPREVMQAATKPSIIQYVFNPMYVITRSKFLLSPPFLINLQIHLDLFPAMNNIQITLYVSFLDLKFYKENNIGDFYYI